MNASQLCPGSPVPPVAARNVLALCWSIFLTLSWLFVSPVFSETFRQPDGSLVQLTPIRSGDASWYVDSQNFTAVQIPPRYEYALPARDGSLKPSGIEVGSVDPQGSALPVRLMPSVEFLRQRRAAVPPGVSSPSPRPVEVKLPDGSVVRLRFKGSGAYSWYQDENGYSVVTTARRFEYALRGPSGHLMPCGILVGSMNASEAGLKPGIRPAVASP